MAWRPIAEARFIPRGTVADLRMPNGRIYRATWTNAWWPEPGQRRKALMGLYDPVEFRVVAIGIVPDGYSDRRRAIGF